MIISVAEMVSVGLTAVAARRHGERRSDEAARIGGRCAGASLVLGAASSASLGCRSAVDTCSRSMQHAARGHRARARLPRRRTLLGAPLIYGFFAVDAAFRAAGDTRTPFVAAARVDGAARSCSIRCSSSGRAGARGSASPARRSRPCCTRGAAFVMGCRHRSPARPDARRTRHAGDACARVAAIGLPTALTGVMFSPDLRRAHAHDDAVRHAGARGARASAIASRAGCT